MYKIECIYRKKENIDYILDFNFFIKLYFKDFYFFFVDESKRYLKYY